MKRIVKKRLSYYCPWTKEVMYGAIEFDGNMSDENILGSVHEKGKTAWLPTYPDYPELWLLKPLPANPRVRQPVYKIEVDSYVVEVPSFFDKLKAALRKQDGSFFIVFRCLTSKSRKGAFALKCPFVSGCRPFFRELHCTLVLLLHQSMYNKVHRQIRKLYR